MRVIEYGYGPGVRHGRVVRRSFVVGYWCSSQKGYIGRVRACSFKVRVSEVGWAKAMVLLALVVLVGPVVLAAFTSIDVRVRRRLQAGSKRFPRIAGTTDRSPAGPAIRGGVSSSGLRDQCGPPRLQQHRR
ncbi:hypothetical protein GCM10009738_67410 [Kitasatospora viridis]